MGLMDKLRKSGTVTVSGILSDSIFFASKEVIETDLPILNIAFSGDVHGGFTSGITVFAGQSKSFKSLLMLYCMKAYLDKYPEAIALFYDSEFGTPTAYFKSLGIDINRVIHIPVTNLDELKFDMVARLEQIERGDKVFVAVDSLGNLASAREVKNAKEENTAKDMSRAGDIKSFFRIITPHFTMKDIPCVIINHIYMEQGAMYPKAIVSGGCLLAGTLIHMADGTLKAIENVAVGDKVKTRYGNKKVIHTWNPDTLENGNPECYKIIFSDGYKVTCSKNHKFLMYGENWVEAKDIKEGMKLLMPDDENLKVVDITPVGNNPVYDISVQDAEHYFLENGVCSHNSGVMLSPNTVFIITKTQEKKGNEIIGYNFTINIEKSRFVREKAKFPFTVLYDSGITKYSGLMDIALESGDVIKPSQGWYQKVNTETGEVFEKKFRLADTMNDDFWGSIISSEHFKSFVNNKYRLGEHSMQESDNVSSSDEDSYDEDI